MFFIPQCSVGFISFITFNLKIRYSIYLALFQIFGKPISNSVTNKCMNPTILYTEKRIYKNGMYEYVKEDNKKCILNLIINKYDVKTPKFIGFFINAFPNSLCSNTYKPFTFVRVKAEQTIIFVKLHLCESSRVDVNIL